MQFPRWLKIVVAVVAVLVVSYPTLIDFLVDWAWFDALGYERALLVTVVTKVSLFGLGALAAGLFMALNLRLALRNANLDYTRLAAQLGAEVTVHPQQLRTLVRLTVAAAVILPAILFGSVASAQWLEVLSWWHRVPFNQVDPIFGRDLGFYFFTWPLLSATRSMAVGIVFLTLIPVALVYLGRDVLVFKVIPTVTRSARRHLLGLLATMFVLVSVGYWLDRFSILLRARGAVFGAGYTDVEAQIPALWFMAGLALVIAATLALSAFRRGWRTPALAFGIFIAAAVLINGVLPGMVQDYMVGPNELEVERPYLEHNIEMTRSAYALDRIEVRPYEAESGLSMQDLDDNPDTIGNIRLWDTRPLQSTYSQLQEIRLYYDFLDVDVDRYQIDGQLRQVMLSARELNYRNVPQKARSWVNEHFQYTHGYGLTMSPVNVVTPEGLPELFIQDLPPKSSVGIDIERPEVYYGELTDRYVLVKTSAEEFDYPAGDQNAYAHYEGEGGVLMDGAARRTLFSLYFRSMDMLLSKYIQEGSRVMFHRRVVDRARQIAPFLTYDGDPYVVVADGRLYWMIDAYTTSDRYPYSEPIRWKDGSFNYIRNSVKVVVDAYNGTTRFYLADTSDPLAHVYANIFPGVFQPLEQMPASLQAHIRYPSDFFDVQAELYRTYHMTDSTVFYNREDQWEIPRELYSGQEQAMESYYLIMKLPGADSEEFVLLLPFAPTNRDNMISWLAARSDPPEYGQLVLYQFPKQKLIFGPRQIEARIDQNPDISEQITLWSQSGSRVLRGNLLVIPIAKSLMYVEPLYLQAESSQLPELKRVIVAYEGKLAMRRTLDEALAAVFGEAPTVQTNAPEQARSDSPASEQTTAAPPLVHRDAGWEALSHQAAQQFEAAQSAMRQGDWAAYGQALQALGETLEKLDADGSKDEAPQVPALPPAAESNEGG